MWPTADQIDLFESAWTFDHFYPINVPDTSGPCLEGCVALAALAQATKRIRIGCMVTRIVCRQSPDGPSTGHQLVVNGGAQH